MWPVAHAGQEAGYLAQVTTGWGNDVHGRGPTGMAIREGRTVVINDVSHATGFEPWREEAARRGFAAAVALPLQIGGRTIGALTIDADESDAFDDEERTLLEELASDLAFGIRSLRVREEQRRAEAAMQASEARYYDLFDHAPAAFSSFRPADGGASATGAVRDHPGHGRDHREARPLHRRPPDPGHASGPGHR